MYHSKYLVSFVSLFGFQGSFVTMVKLPQLGKTCQIKTLVAFPIGNQAFSSKIMVTCYILN